MTHSATNDMQMKAAKNIAELIGNTPLVELSKLNKFYGTEFYAKLESFNPMSSIKDRIAAFLIEKAEESCLLQPGGTIVEPTSGNTGIGLAFISAIKGYKLILTMPDTMSTERQNMLAAFGAEIILTQGSAGMKGAIDKAEILAKEIPGAYMPRQFKNMHNPETHTLTTAEEIWADTGGRVCSVIAGAGTGGTISGIAKGLKSKNGAIKCFAFEPKNSAVIQASKEKSRIKPGAHKIQGIGAGFIPETTSIELIDYTVSISDEAAYFHTNRLAKEEGILAGVSSGACLAAGLNLYEMDMLPKGPCVLIFADSGERYLSVKGLFS
jgi:cysteine synthase